mmetsp:Transcript_27124/g.56804  ORF Transcript_27124/g.56804 Transcript_27124/m.56804 type:complete len:717 (+) Transcript_27124:235-2385(+)
MSNSRTASFRSSAISSSASLSKAIRDEHYNELPELFAEAILGGGLPATSASASASASRSTQAYANYIQKILKLVWGKANLEHVHKTWIIDLTKRIREMQVFNEDVYSKLTEIGDTIVRLYEESGLYQSVGRLEKKLADAIGQDNIPIADNIEMRAEILDRLGNYYKNNSLKNYLQSRLPSPSKIAKFDEDIEVENYCNGDGRNGNSVSKVGKPTRIEVDTKQIRIDMDERETDEGGVESADNDLLGNNQKSELPAHAMLVGSIDCDINQSILAEECECNATNGMNIVDVELGDKLEQEKSSEMPIEEYETIDEKETLVDEQPDLQNLDENSNRVIALDKDSKTISSNLAYDETAADGSLVDEQDESDPEGDGKGENLFSGGKDSINSDDEESFDETCTEERSVKEHAGQPDRTDYLDGILVTSENFELIGDESPLDELRANESSPLDEIRSRLDNEIITNEFVVKRETTANDSEEIKNNEKNIVTVSYDEYDIEDEMVKRSEVSSSSASILLSHVHVPNLDPDESTLKKPLYTPSGLNAPDSKKSINEKGASLYTDEETNAFRRHKRINADGEKNNVNLVRLDDERIISSDKQEHSTPYAQHTSKLVQPARDIPDNIPDMIRGIEDIIEMDHAIFDSEQKCPSVEYMIGEIEAIVRRIENYAENDSGDNNEKSKETVFPKLLAQRHWNSPHGWIQRKQRSINVLRPPDPTPIEESN